MSVPGQVISVCSSQDARIEILALLDMAPNYVLHSNQTESRTWANWGICDDNSSKFAQVVSALDGAGRLALGWLKGGQIWVCAANQPNGGLSNAFALDSQGLAQLKLLTNLDGRLEFLALSTKNELWSIAQSQAGSWNDMGIYDLAGTDLQQIAGTRYGDGRLTAVALGKDKQVYRKEQNGPGNLWGQWMGLGGTDIQGIAAAANADGRLEVMVIGGDGNLWDYYQTTTGGWSGWQLAVKGSFIGVPQLAKNADGRLEVFAFDKNGSIYHSFQTEKNGAWIVTPVQVDPTRQYSNFAVTALTDGRLVLLAQVDCAFIVYAQAQKNATSLTQLTGPSAPCPPQVSFSANPNPAAYNGVETLSWEVSGCEEFDILLTGQASGEGVVTISPPPPATAWPASGTTQVRMTKPAKFTLTAACSGSPFTTVKSHSVGVSQPPPVQAILEMTVAIVPTLPLAGTNFSANVTVKNIGNADSTAFHVLMSITSTGGDPPSQTSSPQEALLQPGGTHEIPFGLTAGSTGTIATLSWTIPEYPTAGPVSVSLAF